MYRSLHGTSTRVRRCATTEPVTTSIVTPTTSSPPTWPPAPDQPHGSVQLSTPTGSIPRTVFPALGLVGFGHRPAVTECDGEGVDHGLPPDHPSRRACPGGVEAAGDKIQALQRGLVGREVSACSHRAPV